jgi:hypothetical protein
VARRERESPARRERVNIGGYRGNHSPINVKKKGRVCERVSVTKRNVAFRVSKTSGPFILIRSTLETRKHVAFTARIIVKKIDATRARVLI